MTKEQLAILDIRKPRFWERVRKTTRCWLWQGAINQNGYGIFKPQVNNHGVSMYAHRLSYYYHTGRMPDKCILHRCDNPLCVRPSHLRSGTRQENQEDMRQKGRACRGEKKHSARLSEKDIRQIIKRLKTREKQAPIARDYDISASVISRINSGTAWSFITKKES